MSDKDRALPPRPGPNPPSTSLARYGALLERWALGELAPAETEELHRLHAAVDAGRTAVHATRRTSAAAGPGRAGGEGR